MSTKIPSFCGNPQF